MGTAAAPVLFLSSPVSPPCPPGVPPLYSVYSVFTVTTVHKHTCNGTHLLLQARGDPAVHIKWAPALPHSWSSPVFSRDIAYLPPEQVCTAGTEEVALSCPPDKSNTISSGHIPERPRLHRAAARALLTHYSHISPP